VPRKEGEASGAPVEEATGTEEAEVAEALLSEPPPPQGMKAAKWSGMLVDNRPPFIFLLVGAFVRVRCKESDGRTRGSGYVSSFHSQVCMHSSSETAATRLAHVEAIHGNFVSDLS
jgi:hypothetical protein